MTQNHATAAAYGESDLLSLSEKLASLDLTDREKAAFDAVLSDDEVSGYGQGGSNSIIAILIGLRGGDPLPTLGARSGDPLPTFGGGAFPPGPPNNG